MRPLALAAAVLALGASASAGGASKAPLPPLTADTPVHVVIARVREHHATPRAGCLEVVDQALTWHPGEPRLFEMRAVCFVVERRVAEARWPAEAAVAADPTLTTAQLIIGAATQRGNPQRAVVAYRAFLDHHREPDRGHDDVEHDEARVRHHLPQRVRADLGLALLRLGRVDEAVEVLEHARGELLPMPTRPPRRERPSYRILVDIARGLCLAYALRDDATSGLVHCEQLVATKRALPDGTAPYALARMFLLAGEPARARLAAADFAAFRHVAIAPAVLADPVALAAWLRAQPAPIPH